MSEKRPILHPTDHTWGIRCGDFIISWEWAWTQTFFIPTLYVTNEDKYRHFRIGFLAAGVGIAWGRKGYGLR